jgi:hypothetical protein
MTSHVPGCAPTFGLLGQDFEGDATRPKEVKMKIEDLDRVHAVLLESAPITVPDIRRSLHPPVRGMDGVLAALREEGRAHSRVHIDGATVWWHGPRRSGTVTRRRIPVEARRSRILHALHSAVSPAPANTIADVARVPHTSIHGDLTDLEAEGMATRDRSTSPHRWSIAAGAPMPRPAPDLPMPAAPAERRPGVMGQLEAKRDALMSLDRSIPGIAEMQDAAQAEVDAQAEMEAQAGLRDSLLKTFVRIAPMFGGRSELLRWLESQVRE